jgi:hypothetical protein
MMSEMIDRDQLEDSAEHVPANHARRVLLLETDERSGLVASIAETCHSHGVSIDITTGLSHVLLTFEADGAATKRAIAALSTIPGVSSVHPYTVMTASAA